MLQVPSEEVFLGRVLAVMTMAASCALIVEGKGRTSQGHCRTKIRDMIG